MDLLIYKYEAEGIMRLIKNHKHFAAKEKFEKLTAVFIQDSVVDIGSGFYGSKIAMKGRVLFDLQQLFH